MDRVDTHSEFLKAERRASIVGHVNLIICSTEIVFLIIFGILATIYENHLYEFVKENIAPDITKDLFFTVIVIAFVFLFGVAIGEACLTKFLLLDGIKQKNLPKLRWWFYVMCAILVISAISIIAESYEKPKSLLYDLLFIIYRIICIYFVKNYISELEKEQYAPCVLFNSV